MNESNSCVAKEKTSALIVNDMSTISMSLDRLNERLLSLRTRIAGIMPMVGRNSDRKDINESVFIDVAGNYLATHKELLDLAHSLMNDIEDHF